MDINDLYAEYSAICGSRPAAGSSRTSMPPRTLYEIRDAFHASGLRWEELQTGTEFFYRLSNSWFWGIKDEPMFANEEELKRRAKWMHYMDDFPRERFVEMLVREFPQEFEAAPGTISGNKVEFAREVARALTALDAGDFDLLTRFISSVVMAGITTTTGISPIKQIFVDSAGRALKALEDGDIRKLAQLIDMQIDGREDIGYDTVGRLMTRGGLADGVEGEASLGRE